MKKIITAVASIIAVLSFTTTALAAAPATPTECSGMTFDNVIVQSRYGVNVTGTAGRDLIFLAGGGSVDAKGGDDCIVGSKYADSINGGAGNDVIIANGWGDSVQGGDGNDTIYGGDGGASLLGGNGNDTIYSPGWGDYVDGGAGVDTCSGVNCEL